MARAKESKVEDGPRYFRPRNWRKFQSYQRARPEYILNHLSLLNDQKYLGLSTDAALALHRLWMLFAAVSAALPMTFGTVSKQINFTSRRFKIVFEELLANDFIEFCEIDWKPYPANARAREDQQDRDRDKEKKQRSSVGHRAAPKRAPNDGSSIEGGSESYAFDGRVIRLTDADFGRWKKSFSHIPDLAGELQRHDDYLAGLEPGKLGNWFARTSAFLANRNTELAAKAAEANAEETAKAERKRKFEQRRKAYFDADEICRRIDAQIEALDEAHGSPAYGPERDALCIKLRAAKDERDKFA